MKLVIVGDKLKIPPGPLGGKSYMLAGRVKSNVDRAELAAHVAAFNRKINVGPTITRTAAKKRAEAELAEFLE